MWDQLILSHNANHRLESLQADGTILAVFPEVQTLVGFGGADSGHKDLWSHTKQVVIQCVPILAVRWAALFHDVGKPQAFQRVDGKICFHHHEAISASLFKRAAKRVGWFEPRLEEEIIFIIRNVGLAEAYESSWSDSAVRRLSKDLGGSANLVLALARGDSTTGNPAKHKKHLDKTSELQKRIEALKAQDSIPQALPKGLGDALMAELKLEAGPELGRVMSGLKQAVEAGKLPRNAEIEVYIQHLRSSV
jgi:poly(A) polymerase